MGSSYSFFAFDFRISLNIICQFNPQVFTAIYEKYKEEMFIMPPTQDEWKAVALQFGIRWIFYHCCRAMDGKHFAAQEKWIALLQF